VVQQNRLRWHGHVLRKNDNDWVKKCIDYKVEGIRPNVGQRRVLCVINLVLFLVLAMKFVSDILQLLVVIVLIWHTGALLTSGCLL